MVKFEITLTPDSAAQMSAAALFFKTLAESASNELPAQPVEMTTDEAPESASDEDLQNLITREELDRRADLMRPYIVYIRKYDDLLHSEDFESELDDIRKGALAEQRFKAEQADEEAKKEAKRKRDRERRAAKKREAEEAEAAKQNEDQTIAAQETDAEATKSEVETPDEPAEVTYNDIRSAISQRAKEHKDELKALVATYGVKLAKDVPSEKWGEFLTAINEIGS